MSLCLCPEKIRFVAKKKSPYGATIPAVVEIRNIDMDEPKNQPQEAEFEFIVGYDSIQNEVEYEEENIEENYLIFHFPKITNFSSISSLVTEQVIFCKENLIIQVNKQLET
jgi:hypothetical protein